MPFILAYWRQIGLAAVIFSLLFSTVLYRNLYNTEKTRYEAFVQEIEVNARVQQANNARIKSEQEQITTNVAKGYADAVQKLNDYYKSHPNVVRVRDNNPTSGGMSCTSESAKGTGEAVKGTAETPSPIGDKSGISRNGDIELNLRDAGEEIIQCQKLIEWELQQESIK